MELNNVIIIAVLYVEIFHCVQAQVTFNPDPDDNKQFNSTSELTSVEIITTGCYSSSPQIKVEYVNIDGKEVAYVIYNSGDNNPVNGSTCGQRQNKYRVNITSLRFNVEPVLVGRTFKLKAIVNNDEGNSTLSRRTYTFPAPFNLTGSSESAVLNSEFNWTCQVTSDYPIIEWYRGSTNLGQIGLLPNKTCVTFATNDSYMYNCQPSALTYTLTISASSLTEELQDSIWRCNAVNDETNGSSFMELDIVVPVTTVTINPGGSGLDADENQTITLTCATNDANPAPTILWYIGSSNVTPQAGSNRTTLTLNVNRNYHNESVRCMAWNSGNTVNLSDSTVLHVRYPPADNEELQITGYSSGQVLYENNPAMVSIYCRQPGGNPLVNMTFTCDSGKGAGSNENTPNEAKRRINLTNRRDLNDKQCICTSTHINGYMRSKSVSFTIYYPPSVPIISASSPFPWKASGTYSLTCNTTPGNPAATTYIWKDGGSVLPITSQTYEINPLNSTDNGRQLSCQVNNNFTLHDNVVLTSIVSTLAVEYDPLVTIEQRQVEVIEGHDLMISCSATGNPAPNVTWYKGPTPVTGSTISSSNYSIVNVSRTATGEYMCEARSSSAGSNELHPSNKTVYVRVFFPPTISMLLQNTTENTENHIISCTATGDPNNATFEPLEQKIGSTSIRNITSFTESSPGNITLTIPRVSYQDMGTYTCLASNGIPDRSNHKIQSGMAYLNVNTSAKFEKMRYTVRSDIDTPAAISIPFYINPLATESDVEWTKNSETSNETLEESANISLSLNGADVQQTLHGVTVTLKGQSANMTIRTFKDYYEGNYTLKIKSGHTDSAEVKITLIRSGPPDTPSEFKLLDKKETSVVLTWNKGSDGGHPQTFVILYKEETAAEYNVKKIVDTTMDITITEEVKNLKSDTNYEFILYSFNEKGNSTGHKTLEERTLKEPSTSTQSSLNGGLVGGAAGGGAALLVIIAVLVVILKRRRNKAQENDSKGILNSKETSAGPSRQSDDDDGEGGLKDNPLYGSSPGGANAVQGASAVPENLSKYAEVVKPKKKTPVKEGQDPPPIYAEVDKSKKKGKGLMKLKKQSPPRVGEDPPPIYAEVNKSNKKNGKGKQQKQKANTGDVYEVVDGFKEKETQFNDPADAQKNTEGGQRGYRNQDGLLYVDVKFDQPPPTGKPIIRGEERTGYAMIEFEEPPTYSTADDVQGAEGGE